MTSLRTRLSALVLAGGLAFTATAPASAANFAIDTTHSNIVFLVNHLGYSRMVGQFQDWSGSFTFDEAKPEASSVKLAIKTESVDTDLQKRDDHLRSADFFNAVEFPEMTFASTGIEVTGENTGKLTGDLTLLGVTKPVTLDVTFNKAATNPWGTFAAGFSATGSLKRSDFGMTTMLGGLGDEIALIIEVEGLQQ
jgi:polyisoprenoid-binding protein YceI